jgi:hypothetical protein
MTIEHRPSVWGVTYYSTWGDGEDVDLFHTSRRSTTRNNSIKPC